MPSPPPGGGGAHSAALGETHVSNGISGSTGEEVETLLIDARARARTLLAENRDSVEAVAQALLAQQTLSGEELAKVVSGLIH